MNKDYSDILNLPHPVSEKHPRMSLYDRAAQFSPFAALTGYDAAIEETGRFTEERAMLDENRKKELDDKLRALLEDKSESRISISYYIPDRKKDGGKYAEAISTIVRIDTYRRELMLEDGTKVPFDDIVDINKVATDY